MTPLGTHTQKYFENKRWPQFIQVPWLLRMSSMFEAQTPSGPRVITTSSLKGTIAIRGWLEVWEWNQLGTFFKPPWNIVVALRSERSCAVHNAHTSLWALLDFFKKNVSDIIILAMLSVCGPASFWRPPCMAETNWHTGSYGCGGACYKSTVPLNQLRHHIKTCISGGHVAVGMHKHIM